MKSKSIKKTLLVTILAAGLTASVLAGCGKSGKADGDKNQADVMEATTDDAENPNAMLQIENPWVETDKEGVSKATGLNIDAPEDATDVQYSYLETGDMAQVTFSYNSHDDWTFRMEKTDALEDISGLYYEWAFQDSVKVGGKEAMEYAYVEGADDSGMIDDLFGVQLINWYDDTTGITYSLSVLGKDLNGMDLQVIAENLFSKID